MLTLVLGIVILLSSFQVPQENIKYRYIGTEKCAFVCHNNAEMGFQYNIMKSGPHSQAYNVLVSEKGSHYAEKANINGNPQESTTCLECHITGAGLDTSFFAVTYKKEEGVTCEACHKGPYITKAFIPEETACLKCHNNSIHQMDLFDFNDKRSKIAHPRPKVKLNSTQPVIGLLSKPSQRIMPDYMVMLSISVQ